MPDEVIQDEAVAESSTATAADPSQATSQPAQPGDPNANTPFHQHPRWQQLMRERSQDRQVIAELHKRLSGYEKTQQTAAQPQPSADEQQALAALEKLVSMHPKLARFLKDEPGQASEKLAALERQVQNLTGYQRNGWVNASRQIITEAATKHGLEPKVLERAALGFLIDDPERYQRFTTGDPEVVREVLKDIEDHVLGKVGRQAANATAQTKLNLVRQPGRPTGSQSGPAAPPPIVPGKEREHLADAHRRAGEMLSRALKE